MILDPTPLAGGRLTVFRPPVKGRLYGAGLDFAYGLENGDADACIILDEFGDQAAVLTGRWGNARFLDHLRPLLDWYDPFCVGERQVGLDVLRALWDDGRWMYFTRDEAHRTRAQRDTLGHHKSHTDTVILSLRRALRTRNAAGEKIDPVLTLHDRETLDELAAYQFLPRSRGGTIEGLHDAEMKMGAPPGSHDDLVMALAYAWMALRELPKFQRAPAPVDPNTMAAMLGHSAVLNPAPKPRSSLLAGR